MSVSEEVRGFIRASLAENNKSLLDQFSKLVAESAEGIKRSSVDAADEQLREIKKMRREEPKSFKRRGNEVQYKFNAKLQDSLDDVKSHLESNAVEKAKASLAEGTSLISDRQKILVGRPLTSTSSTSLPILRKTPNGSGALRIGLKRLLNLLLVKKVSFARSSGLPSRQGNCFACGRFGHWRSECSLVSRVPKGNSDAR